MFLSFERTEIELSKESSCAKYVQFRTFLIQVSSKRKCSIEEIREKKRFELFSEIFSFKI